MAEPLEQAGIFPPRRRPIPQMVEVGESTGALDSMLNKIADFYESVDNMVTNLTAMMEPMIMICPRRCPRRPHHRDVSPHLQTRPGGQVSSEEKTLSHARSSLKLHLSRVRRDHKRAVRRNRAGSWSPPRSGVFLRRHGGKEYVSLNNLSSPHPPCSHRSYGSYRSYALSSQPLYHPTPHLLILSPITPA